MKHTEFQKQVKAVLGSQTDVIADKVTYHQDGTVTVRRSFFYRHGGSSEKFARAVEAALRKGGLVAIEVAGFEEFRQWPGDSYYCAKVMAR